ncbi:hypothetical protein ACXZ65_37735 [Streptomyces aculeolatus]|uniref:hypothetical protein n=1 Tax=Streptomyces aculeolatus TaxID=270689 RepID=UPI001CED20A9|nr:hypothetical protein [Streptomyces aculeolatus]
MAAEQRRTVGTGTTPARPGAGASGRTGAMSGRPGAAPAGRPAAVLGLLGALAAAALSATAGCSERGAAADEHPGGDPLTAVQRAADALADAGSSRARTAMEMTSGGTRVTVSGDGAFDYVGRRGLLRVVLPQGEEPITELYAGGELYMKNRGAGVPTDKWLRLDTTRLSDGNLVTNGATDPLTAAELLRGAREVRYVGEERVGDSVVRHYEGTADLGRAARAASPYARGALAAAADGFVQDAVPFDAYLDEDGRPRRVRHEFALSGDSPVRVASTVETYDFGAPAEVTLPADRDIYAGTVRQSGQQTAS